MKKTKLITIICILGFCLFFIIFNQVTKHKATALSTSTASNSSSTTDNLPDKELGNEASIKEESSKENLDKPKVVAETVAKEKTNTAIATDKNQNLEQKIKSYIGSNTSKIGLVYYDLNTGKSIVINGTKTFTAASTVKVPMNMVLFDLIQKGKISIDENLMYQPDDYEGGTGILQSKDLSKPIPLKTLSDYSIIYSDNIATRMIIRRIGRENMKNLFDAKLGHATNHSGNYITPNDAATFLKLLYKNPSKNPYYPQLISVMKRTTFHDRIDRYIPQSKVAHKIGNYGAFVNDIGIIYTDKPYVLVIYTEGLSGANEIIANISKLIYNEQIK